MIALGCFKTQPIKSYSSLWSIRSFKMNSDPSGRPFQKLKNDNILRAIRGEKPDRVPVWVMRQAGRHLPEYLELTKGTTFIERLKNPEMASDITIQPVTRYDVDAAIVFSDILVIPTALGYDVEYGGKSGHSKLEISKWRDQIDSNVDIGQKLHYLYETITMTRHKLAGRCPVIGFAGCPWTLMSYMIEGTMPRKQLEARAWLYEFPSDSRELLEILSVAIVDHLVNQVKAGAQLLQLFGSLCQELSDELFEEFIYPFHKKICYEVKNRIETLTGESVPIIILAKGGYQTNIFGRDDNDFDVISIDWRTKPEEIRNVTTKCLQGNLDSSVLLCSPDVVIKQTKLMLERFGTHKYIANVGEALRPGVSTESVKAFIDCVHNY